MNSVERGSYVDDRYPLSAETAQILAAAHEVHRHLGPGFEEVIYQRALAKELPVYGLEFSREVWMDVLYKGEKVGRKRVDFVIGAGNEAVLVEIKAKAKLEDVDFVQALSYLKAAGCRVGLLINFGAKWLETRRLAKGGSFSVLSRIQYPTSASVIRTAVGGREVAVFQTAG